MQRNVHESEDACCISYVFRGGGQAVCDGTSTCLIYTNIDFFNMYDGTIEKRLLRYFASHLMENGGDEVRKKIQIMQKEEFANHYTLEVSRELVKKHEHEFHVNWWNFEKAYNMLKKSGFTKIYRSEQRKSKFKEMQNNLFDSTWPRFSLYVEAIK